MLPLHYELLKETFPEEKTIPDMLELKSRASLEMSWNLFGNSKRMDGLGPMMPSNLFVGMMDCKHPGSKEIVKNRTLPKKLQVCYFTCFLIIVAYNLRFIVLFLSHYFHVENTQNDSL